MGSTTLRIRTSKTHRDQMFLGTKDMWQNSLLFDCTLKVEEEEIPVHKVILASCSGYFRAMFTGNMKESNQNSVRLKGLKPNTVKTLVHFIYTGEMAITRDTMEDILSAANYLHILSAVELCCEFMFEDLNWESVSDNHRLIQLYSLDGIEKAADPFFLKSLDDMPDDVMESVVKQALTHVGSNALCVKSEFSLFKKLLAFKSVLSDDEFYEAMCKVRFPLMSKDELEKVSSSGVMISRLSPLLKEAVRYHNDVIGQPNLQEERTKLRSDKHIFIAATKTDIHVLCEDQSTKILKEFPDKQVSPDPCIQCVATVDNFLYVCVLIQENGLNSISLCRYDPRFDTWQKLDPLLFSERRDYPLVVFDKKLFAIGGSGSTTVEAYDIQTNKWKYCSDIIYNNPYSAGAALGGKIYVCGGVEDELPFTDNLTCYDPQNDTWEFRAPMQNRKTEHFALAFDDKLYTFERFEGYTEASSRNVEYYDPQTDQWTDFFISLGYLIEGVYTDGSFIYLLNEECSGHMGTMLVTVEKFDTETHKRIKVMTDKEIHGTGPGQHYQFARVTFPS